MGCLHRFPSLLREMGERCAGSNPMELGRYSRFVSSHFKASLAADILLRSLEMWHDRKLLSRNNQ